MPKLLFKLIYRLLILGCLSSFVFAQDKARAELGLSIYQSAYCGLCHQSSAAETEGIFGPPHDAVAIIAQARILDPHYYGKAETVEAYLLESVLEPELYIVPGYELTPHRMPSYKHLSEEDLNALIYFLLNQKEVVDN